MRQIAIQDMTLKTDNCMRAIKRCPISTSFDWSSRIGRKTISVDRTTSSFMGESIVAAGEFFPVDDSRIGCIYLTN